MRAITAARSSALSLPFWTSFSSVASIFLRPLSAHSRCASTSTTSMPDCAATCAMPPPIWPAPMTPIFCTCILSLDHHGDRLAAADAQRRHAALLALALQRIQQRRQDARARGADGMPERDRAAQHVDPLGIEIEQLIVGDGDHRERLVNLVEIDVADAEPGLLERALDRNRRRRREPLRRLRRLRHG